MKTKIILRFIMVIAAMITVPQLTVAQEYETHTTAYTKKITLRGNVNYVGRFSEGLACVNPNNGNWFVIDKTGNKVFDFPEGYRPAGVNRDGRVEAAFYYEGGRLMILQDKRGTGFINAAIIDKTGKVVKQWQEIKSASPFLDGLAVVQLPNGRSTTECHVDHDGNIVSNTVPAFRLYYHEHCKVFPLSDNLRIYYDNSKKAYGYMDKKCSIVIEAQYKECGNFCYGLAKVKNSEGLWGFIDHTGKYAIEPIYSNEPTDFNDSHAFVCDKAGKEHLIDRKGKIFWSNDEHYEVRPFLGKGAEAFSIWDKRTRVYVVSKDLSMTECDFNYHVSPFGKVTNFNSKWIELKPNNVNYLLIYRDGRMRLSYVGEPFSDGLAVCSYHHNKGYINDKGEIVILFEDTQF